MTGLDPRFAAPEGWPGIFRAVKHYVPSGARRLLLRGALIVFAECGAACGPKTKRTAELPWCSACRRKLDLIARPR